MTSGSVYILEFDEYFLLFKLYFVTNTDCLQLTALLISLFATKVVIQGHPSHKLSALHRGKQVKESTECNCSHCYILFIYYFTSHQQRFLCFR